MSLLFVIFRFFEKYKIHTQHAITVNYWVAFLCGILQYYSTVTEKCNSFTKLIKLSEIVSSQWFIYAMGMGVVFISIFFLMAKTTQKLGITTSVIANKMSLVIPVGIAIFLFGERENLLQKSIGISLALIALVLITLKDKDERNTINNTNPSKQRENSKKNITQWLLPIAVFIGSGFIDTSLNYLNENLVKSCDTSLFSSSIFLMAGCIGIILIIIQFLRNQTTVSLRSVIGGIVLGIPNFFSIFFLLQTLSDASYESATIFVLINIGVLLLSTLLGLVLFKEKLNLKNWIGVIIAIICVLVIHY